MFMFNQRHWNLWMIYIRTNRCWCCIIASCMPIVNTDLFICSFVCVCVCVCETQLQKDKNDKWFWHRNDDDDDYFMMPIQMLWNWCDYTNHITHTYRPWFSNIKICSSQIVRLSHRLPYILFRRQISMDGWIQIPFDMNFGCALRTLLNRFQRNKFLKLLDRFNTWTIETNILDRVAQTQNAQFTN